MTIEAYTAALRQHGYKLTPQRLAVLRVIVNSHDHLTAEAIYERVRRDYPSIGLVTVYRMLDVMAGLDLICKIHLDDACRSYLVRRSSAHHHHIMCTVCSRVADFTKCDLGGLQRRISAETGFKIQDHLLQFNGLCRECQTKTRQAASGRRGRVGGQ